MKNKNNLTKKNMQAYITSALLIKNEIWKYILSNDTIKALWLVSGKLSSLKKWQRLTLCPKESNAVSFLRRNIEEKAFFRSTVSSG